MSRIKWRFSDFEVKSKLAVLIYMFIASLLVMGLFSRLLFNTSQTVTILVSEQRVFLENFNSGIKYFYQYEISGNEDYLEPAKSSFRKAHSIAFTFARIDSLIHAMDKNEWVPLFYDIFKEGANYDYKKVEMLARQIHWFVKINPDKISDIQKTAYDASRVAENVIGSVESYRLSGDQQELNDLEEKFLKVNAISNEFSSSVYNLIEYINRMMHFFIAALVLLIIISGTFIAIIIARSISVPIMRLAKNFKLIAKGNLNSSVNIESDNEIGELSKAFSEIQVGLQDIISYSKKVAKGDYSSKLLPKSNEDELTISLNKMA
ncbi:MAG: HAMP domain-containing protein, partial [Mariniphaga sp.]